MVSENGAVIFFTISRTAARLLTPSDEDLSPGTPVSHPSDEDLSLGTPVSRSAFLFQLCAGKRFFSAMRGG
jgi:hypothetical protein